MDVVGLHHGLQQLIVEVIEGSFMTFERASF